MADADAEAHSSAEISSQEHAAWWLALRKRGPEWQALSAAGQATLSGRPRASFEQAQVGDPVVVYVSRPDHSVRLIGVITAASSDQPTPRKAAKAGAPWIEVQRTFELPTPLSWQEVLHAPGLAEAVPVRQRSSTMLLPLKAGEYTAIQAMILAHNPELEGAFAALEATPHPHEAQAEQSIDARIEAPVPTLRERAPEYNASSVPQRSATLPQVRSLENLQRLTGMPAATLEEICDLLESTRQIVLSGPPGTGKTWLARGLAALLSEGAGERVQIVQFHPSTAYEDFIEGLKPQVDAWGRVTYAVVPGIFTRICRQARDDPDHRYVLLIDEINRAPLSRVFGELLYALEYRGPEGTVELSVSGGMGEQEPFYVPTNLLLVGTMNSADRSLAMVDYALRRRFRFIEIEPDAGVLDSWLAQHGTPAPARKIVLELFREVNARLAESLDPDHRLGHAYFMLDPLTPTTLDRLWRTAIKPLVTEYFAPALNEVEEYRDLFAQTVSDLSS